jgi:hypothetical protein
LELYYDGRLNMFIVMMRMEEQEADFCKIYARLCADGV